MVELDREFIEKVKINYPKTAEKIIEAYKFAVVAHGDIKRKSGEPYIIHPIAVYEMLKSEGYGEDYLITALFHDLLEDTSTTEQEILDYGNEEVLKAVKLLTKKKGDLELLQNPHKILNSFFTN